MPAIVIDASALAAVVFDEPEGRDVAARLDRAEHVDAPGLLWYEMASVCAKKIHRHPEAADDLRTALREATDLPVRTHTVDPLDAVTVAQETGLSASAMKLLNAFHQKSDRYGSVVVIGYEALVPEPDRAVPGDDVTEIRWVSRERIPPMPFQSHQRMTFILTLKATISMKKGVLSICLVLVIFPRKEI